MTDLKRQAKSIRYSDVMPWGRSFDEYIDMFLLSRNDLQRKILCVGDGPASFNAEMKRRGFTITSIDPSYTLTAEDLRKKISESFDIVMNQTKQNTDKFVWTRFKNIIELGKIRMSAMNEFCVDYEVGKFEGRYIPASLPSLPFINKSFDLILMAHLLFFYSENFSEEFHISSIKEMIRLGNEIRIFPIVDLNSQKSPYFDAVISYLRKNRIRHSIERVNYHFQKTGDEMLRIFSA
jgi:SAM-dependent methyltransferase